MRTIVITSIFPPTEAVRKFAEIEGWNLIVVGDRKTPKDWAHPGVRYLGEREQEATPYALTKALPWNHYCRKMIGYLEAIAVGAEVIADSDDDNIPFADWDFPSFRDRYECTPQNAGFINIYRGFTNQPIWPRGFPLERILDPASQDGLAQWKTTPVEIGVWQALADDDPDVDAIYRLRNNTPCFFRKRTPIVLSSGTACPFNSQNTAFHRSVFPLLYLPAHVPFRFTDILRGLVAQPIMWLEGKHLGFTQSTVVQARNPHNYLADFASEIPCYLHAQKVIEITSAAVAAGKTMEENLLAAYEALHRAEIVDHRELVTLAAWLQDVRPLLRNRPSR